MWMGEPVWYLAMVKVGFTSIFSADCAGEIRENAHAKMNNAEFRARLHMASRIGRSTNPAYHSLRGAPKPPRSRPARSRPRSQTRESRKEFHVTHLTDTQIGQTVYQFKEDACSGAR